MIAGGGRRGNKLIIDFHAHILPGIDDGARDVETSLEMLRRSREQGVDTIVATSHFYASRDRVERFIEKRSGAFEALRTQLPPDAPRIVLGAEVAFFRGISTAEQIEALRIEGTPSMLLEMPFGPWTQQDVDEVSDLIQKRGFSIILAHLERYIPMWENRDGIRRLIDMPLNVQINAEGLLDWRERGKLVKMFKNGQAHLLGSDCHSLHRRPPNLGQGRDVLKRKLGEQALDAIDRRGEQILLG